MHLSRHAVSSLIVCCCVLFFLMPVLSQTQQSRLNQLLMQRFGFYAFEPYDPPDDDPVAYSKEEETEAVRLIASGEVGTFESKVEA